MIVRAAPPEDFNWLIQRTGIAITSGFRGIEVVDKSGTIRGMAGFDHWTDNSVQIHIALDSAAALRALLPAFAYPFEHKGVLLGTIRASNSRSLKLAKRVGFREVCRIRDGAAVGEDAILFEMRREDCRFLTQVRERKAA